MLLDVNQVFVRQGVLLKIDELSICQLICNSSSTHMSGNGTASSIYFSSINEPSDLKARSKSLLGGGYSRSSAGFWNTGSAGIAANSTCNAGKSQSSSVTTANSCLASSLATTSSRPSVSSVEIASRALQATSWPNSMSNANNNLIRQCFLFTNYLLLCSRTKDGRLKLLDVSTFDKNIESGTTTTKKLLFLFCGKRVSSLYN